jgi:hypothetical protein
LKWLTVGGDASYEQYNYKMASRYVTDFTTAAGNNPVNDWKSKSKDEFYNFGVNAVLDIIPKKFNITLGYSASLGYTTMTTSNPNFVPPPSPPGTNAAATAYYWDKVFNVLQTFRIVAKYFVTEKLSLRGGFASERFSEKDFARDPMQPFMGFYEQAVPNGPPVAAGIQSVYLGATVPSYEAYTLSGFVRYEF